MGMAVGCIWKIKPFAHPGVWQWPCAWQGEWHVFGCLQPSAAQWEPSFPHSATVTVNVQEISGDVTLCLSLHGQYREAANAEGAMWEELSHLRRREVKFKWRRNKKNGFDWKRRQVNYIRYQLRRPPIWVAGCSSPVSAPKKVIANSAAAAMSLLILLDFHSWDAEYINQILI